MEVVLRVLERNEFGTVEQTGTKTFKAAVNPAKSWARAPRTMWWGLGDREVPQLSSAIRLSSGTSSRGSSVSGSLGYMVAVANNVYKSPQGTYLLSGAAYEGNGLHVFPENFRRCTALFAARKSVKGNWINDKDEYNAPNEVHPDYEQWVNDSIIYSLFNASSQQSSLRGIDYKGESWDIENEFFWMSNEEIRDLADEHGFVELYNDAMRFKEDRYVYNELRESPLSPDAQALLDRSKELVREAMPFREQAHQAMPEMHLDAWDAGWYQIRKGILEQYFPDEYEDFRKQFLEFEDRMREGVFKFGFLEA